MPQRTPEVNHVNEFREIANDFTNPLEIIREAISNCFDAKAKNITLTFDVIDVDGTPIFKIVIRDDGEGMNTEDLVHFLIWATLIEETIRQQLGKKATVQRFILIAQG